MTTDLYNSINSPADTSGGDRFIITNQSDPSMLLTVENVLSIAEAIMRAPEETILSKKTEGGIDGGVLSEIESKRLAFDTLSLEDLIDFQTRANTLRDKTIQDLQVPLTVEQVDLIDADITAVISRYSLRGISRLTGIR